MSVGVANVNSQNPSMIYGKVAVDPFSRLPDDICREILRFTASSYDLGSSCLVSKRWEILGRSVKSFVQAEEKARIYQTVAFSKAKWNFHFGQDMVTDDDFSSLPQDIGTILSSPCRAFSEKRVIDTHMLVYLPESIKLPNAEGVLERVPFTLRNLGRLMVVKEILEESFQGFAAIFSEIWTRERDRTLGESRWVLMTKDVLPGSRDKSYGVQVWMIENLTRKAGMSYEVPRLLEAATCIYMWYLDSGEMLFNKDSYPGTFTSCEESFEDNQVIIGGFDRLGLHVYKAHQCRVLGVAASLRMLK